MEQICTALDPVQLAAVIFLDFFFVKAFDTINHIATCNKLAACGTLPQTVTWFQSQFCQLKAVVGNSDSSSPGAPVERSVVLCPVCTVH